MLLPMSKPDALQARGSLPVSPSVGLHLCINISKSMTATDLRSVGLTHGPGLLTNSISPLRKLAASPSTFGSTFVGRVLHTLGAPKSFCCVFCWITPLGCKEAP